MPTPSSPPHPPPTDITDGDFKNITDGQHLVQTVLTWTASASDTVSATITSGAPAFQLDALAIFKWTLDAGHPTALPPDPAHWALVPTTQSKGTAVAVDSGDVVQVTVALQPPPNTPYGSLEGTLVVKGAILNKTVPLRCDYLGVDLNSDIGLKWQSMGGAGFFGEVLGNVQAAPDGRGTMQQFANGVLYQLPQPIKFSPSGVNVARPGVIETSPQSAARPPSGLKPSGGAVLNHPVVGQLQLQDVFYFSNECYAKWTSPSVMTAKDSNGHTVMTSIGVPTADTRATSENGQAITFESGIIVIRNDKRAFVVYGAIHTHYVELGDLFTAATTPVVGFPASDESAAASGGGRFNTFDQGAIYWSSGTGAHEVHGAIYQKWSALGADRSALAYPLTDETIAPDGSGRFNDFQNGSIYWSPTSDAHELRTPIRDHWRGLNGVNSYLGYPVTDQGAFQVLGSTFQGNQFQRGTINDSPQGVVTDVPAQVVLSQEVVTPSGTALGGNVQVTLNSDGSYQFKVHMHDSGFDAYSFRVVAIVSDSTGQVQLAAVKGGSVQGTSSGLNPNRDFDATETGNNPMIQLHWDTLQSATLNVSKSYQDDLLAGVENLVSKVLEFAVAAVASAPMAAMIFIGSELGQVNSIKWAPVQGIAGLVLYGASAFLLGPAGLALVAGIAAATAASTRSMTPEEGTFIDQVFKGTVPYHQVVLTSLTGVGGRPFTFPNIDGSILVNLGAAFNDPTHSQSDGQNDTNEAPGELFIHELTHAWQIAHNSFTTGWICNALGTQASNSTGSNVYAYGPAGPSWGSFNIEQQAMIVQQWYAGTRNGSAGPMKQNDPYFRYIATNIWLGQT
jgi:hypothetical protein